MRSKPERVGELVFFNEGAYLKFQRRMALRRGQNPDEVVAPIPEGVYEIIDVRTLDHKEYRYELMPGITVHWAWCQKWENAQ